MIKKNLDLIIVGLIMLALIMFEETYEMLEELLHLLFEVLHNLFEVVELGVEGAVEHAFHALHVGEFFAYIFITERHASQVFTFYILMSIICYIVFRLSRFVPKIFESAKQTVLYAWIRRKTQCQLFWRALSRPAQIAVMLSVSASVILAAFVLI